MSNLSIEGEVKEILTPESGTSKAGKDWNKQEFVIETNDQYPKPVCFTCFGDKTDLISNIKVGENVEVGFNLESREYNGKYFHNVTCWRILKEELSNDNDVISQDSNVEDDSGDDLPF